MVRSGHYGQVLQVGNMLLISRQQLADEICRRLANPKKDERRVVIEHFDKLQADAATETRKEREKQDKERKRRFSPEGRKAAAEYRGAQEAAAAKDNPDFGTRRARLSLITPHLPKTNFRPRPEPVRGHRDHRGGGVGPPIQRPPRHSTRSAHWLRRH